MQPGFFCQNTTSFHVILSIGKAISYNTYKWRGFSTINERKFGMIFLRRCMNLPEIYITPQDIIRDKL